jgi:replicative DNA helicase
MNKPRKGEDLLKLETELSQYQGDDRIISSHELAEDLKNTAGSVFGVSTNIPTLDRLLEKTEAGELILVTGPTGEGKTTLLMTITKNIANANINSCWFTLEVTPRQFLHKLVIGGGKLPLFYLPNQNIENHIDWLEKRIIEAKVKFDTKVVFIDHIHQIFSLNRVSTNISLEIGDLVAKIKDIAIQHNLIIFLIAHCKDDPQQTNREPRKEDIRDSGLISRLADTIIAVWRTTNEDDGKTTKRKTIEEDDNRAKVRVLKNRRTGKLGTFLMEHKDHYLTELDLRSGSGDFKDFENTSYVD